MTESASPVRFDDAGPLALVVARDIAFRGVDVLLVRDILGRFSLVADDRHVDVDDETVTQWRERLSGLLGPYAAERSVVLRSDVFMADTIFDSPRIIEVLDPELSSGHGRIRRLDNTVVGEDWARVSDPSQGNGGRLSRTVLYGFKGGVGRSTATFMLAKYLADQDLCVLVIDLDLESPGSGPMLVNQESLPRYGLIDQLVESALKNSRGLDLVVRASNVVPRGNGEIWVAPARGRDATGYSYIDKLNRVYAAVPGSGANFADRLEVAVQACEDAVGRLSRQPDVVLLDSRAGLHDIAAVAISRLCDLALLFGSDSLQTWTGYRDLFLAWQQSGQAEAIREKLRMVAAMVADTADAPKAAYLASFREHAWSCLSILYDDLPTGESVGFNPSPEDESAPHSPIPILFTMELVGLDAASTVGWDDLGFVQAAYHAFVRTASQLIIEGR